jgi:cytoplasmic iron level regulating protein YaaA (DUF328/UPF0246 family)
MLILLSPSKTQEFEAAAPTSHHSQAALLNESATLITALRALSTEDLCDLMDVSPKIAALNHERYLQFKRPFTLHNAKQAMYAFQGDVYDGLNAPSLDKSAIDFAQAHLRILSGLYGVLKPLDLIQPYRLEMKIKLANPRGKDLYHFWGDRLTDLLARELKQQDSKIVVNLASQEYFHAIDPDKLGGTIITPQFQEKKGKDYKMIALFAKQARGRMAHYITSRQITSADGMQFFAEDGYRLNVALSTPQAPVYTRESKAKTPTRDKSRI